MHREVGRLFQHDGKRILVDDLHRDLRLGGHARAVFGQLEGDVLPGGHPAVGKDGFPLRKKAAAVEFHRAGKLGGDGAHPQKIAQQRAIRFGRDGKDQLHPFFPPPKIARDR